MSDALPPNLVEPLTEREQQILRLLAEGLTNRGIADRLFLSYEAVKWYNKQLYAKLGVHNRTQAAARARDSSLLIGAGQSAAARPAHNLPAPGEGASITLTRYLRNKHALLVLDTFEHRLEAAALLLELLTAAVDLRLLITSREALGAYGETVYPVLALVLPDSDQLQPGSEAAESEAIELAAARVKRLSAAELLGQLDRAVDLLDSGPRGVELSADHALMQHGESDRAAGLLTDTLEIYRELGDPRNTAWALASLSFAWVGHSEQYPQALSACEEALSLLERQQDEPKRATALTIKGQMARAAGDLEVSERAAQEALDLSLRIGTLTEAADQPIIDEYAAAVRQKLGELEFESARAKGRAMELADAVDYVLAGSPAAT